MPPVNRTSQVRHQILLSFRSAFMTSFKFSSFKLTVLVAPSFVGKFQSVRIHICHHNMSGSCRTSRLLPPCIRSGLLLRSAHLLPVHQKKVRYVLHFRMDQRLHTSLPVCSDYMAIRYLTESPDTRQMLRYGSRRPLSHPYSSPCVLPDSFGIFHM